VFSRKKPESRTRLFFATDIHGSEQCFRKWLNSAKVYEPDVLILGGDVTGKVLVPLVAEPDGSWRGSLFDRPLHARDSDELAAIQKQIRAMGRYPVVMDPDEKAELDASPDKVDVVFRQAMRDTLAQWVALAEERLAPLGIPAYMMLGNDDFDDLADVLRGSKIITYAEDGIFELPGGYELLSIGYSTPTPWHTEREISEAEVQAKIDDLAAQLRDPSAAVFNIHCPPYDTHLDQAPQLDENLRPVVDASGLRMASVGSTAVRSSLERIGPLLGLHGHIHESAAAQKVGRAVSVNPGSDYGDGVLRGAIIDLDQAKGVKRWQLVQG
jgi:Icc-related predicted phosphoesterase